MKLLHIDSSITGDGSVSKKLTRQITNKLKSEYTNLQIVYYDLNETPLPFLNSDSLKAEQKPEHEKSENEKREAVMSAQAMNDFLSADIIVIGAPMYNLSIPAQLKAWIDRISVAGKTFRYTANGPQGLAGGKKVIIASSRGGIYSTPEGQASDHQETYLKTMMNFLGITDIEFIRAEGVNMGAENAAKAMNLARQAIENLSRAAATAA